MSLLELDELSLSFGGLRALSELDLRVEEREIVSVIGPNGADKTSVFNVIIGMTRPKGTSGSRARASPAASRTRSPATESLGRSRAFACSSTCRSRRT